MLRFALPMLVDHALQLPPAEPSSLLDMGPKDKVLDDIGPLSVKPPR